MLMRPMRGLATLRISREYTMPMAANWASIIGRAVGVGARVQQDEGLVGDGNTVAMAGRCTPSSVRSFSWLAATWAPVLPARKKRPPPRP
jgi:hypothetical protein